MDRAATAWTALNGFTMNCVQCHSHPYDPVRHEDYYRFLAFFNNTRDADLPNDAPSMPVPKNPADYATADATWREPQAARARLVDASRQSVEARRGEMGGGAVVAARSDAVAALEREIEFEKRNPEVVVELKAALAKVKAEPSEVEPKFRLQDGEAITVGTGRNITIYEYDIAPNDRRAHGAARGFPAAECKRGAQYAGGRLHRGPDRRVPDRSPTADRRRSS